MTNHPLRISRQTTQETLAQSSGEVTQPITVTEDGSVEGGLCCPRIFGLTRERSCLCGRYSGEETTRISCEVCGCPLLTRVSMHDRFGHITLAAPISHPWFASGAPLEVLPVLPLLFRQETHTPSKIYDSADEVAHEERAAEGEREDDTKPLNQLYQRILESNRRLRGLYEVGAPDAIQRNERERLATCIRNLFSQIRRRFAASPFEKTVDFSGGAVVAPDPEMSLSHCGIPLSMALTLWRPFLFQRLQRDQLASSFDDALDLLAHDPEAFDLLQEVMRERPVLVQHTKLSREPGLLWMIPRLVSGEAIRLHPLLLKRWSIHAEGERLSVHVLLSPEASAEARKALRASACLVSPLSGRSSLSLTEMAHIGLFSLTHPSTPAAVRRVVSLEEALFLYRQGLISHHEELSLRYQGQRFTTTAGRILLAECAPELPFEVLNQAQTSSALSRLIHRHLSLLGASQTEALLLSLEALGVEHATRAGLSLCIGDLVQPPKKDAILQETRGMIESVYEQLDESLILEHEKTNKVIDLWARAMDQLRSDAAAQLRSARGLLWLYTQCVGSVVQMLSAFGFTTKGPPDEEGQSQLHEQPILENQREGLSSVSFFYAAKSSRGSALSVMSLAEENDASQRALSRALRDVALTQDDCQTSDGVVLSGPSWPTALHNFATQMNGRVLAQDIAEWRAGHRLSLADAEALRAAGVNSIKVRSALTCAASEGVCVACYGSPLCPPRGVGFLAAQAFELNRHRWHRDRYPEREAIAPLRGVVRFEDARVITRHDGQRLLVSRRATWALYDQGRLLSHKKHIPYGATLLVHDGELVAARQSIARWSPYQLPLLAEQDGVLHYRELSPGENFENFLCPNNGLTRLFVRPRSAQAAHRPSIQIQDPTSGESTSYKLRWYSRLLFDDGAQIRAGDVLAERYKSPPGRSHRLLREILEATPPKEGALLASISGVISTRDVTPEETLVRITADDGASREQLVPTPRLEVEDGDEVIRGERLSGGDDDPNIILQTLGAHDAKLHLLGELKERLEADGAGLAVQHIEVLLREMFGAVRLIEAGGSDLAVGDVISRRRYLSERAAALSQRRPPPVVAPVLMGVSALAAHKTSALEHLYWSADPHQIAEMVTRGELIQHRL